jgi:hypothetical protein
VWWTRPDLDGHLSVLQTGALPIELRAHERRRSRVSALERPCVTSFLVAVELS